MATGTLGTVGSIVSMAGTAASAAGSIGGIISGTKANNFNIQAVRETNEANYRLAQYQFEQNKLMQREAFKHNFRMSEYEYQKNLEQWNRQNEYNSPSAVMSRLKEAGLNPNLAYGNGSQWQSGSSPQYNAPAYTPAQFQSPRMSAAQKRVVAYESMLQLGRQAAEINLIKRQADYIDQQRQESISRNSKLLAETTGLKISNDVRDRLRDYDVVKGQAEANRMNYLANVAQALGTPEMIQVRTDTERKKLDLLVKQLDLLANNLDITAYKANLAKNGIDPDSGAWMSFAGTIVSYIFGEGALKTIIDQAKDLFNGLKIFE